MKFLTTALAEGALRATFKNPYPLGKYLFASGSESFSDKKELYVFIDSGSTRGGSGLDIREWGDKIAKTEASHDGFIELQRIIDEREGFEQEEVKKGFSPEEMALFDVLAVEFIKRGQVLPYGEAKKSIDERRRELKKV